jgi:hypothetical protein
MSISVMYTGFFNLLASQVLLSEVEPLVREVLGCAGRWLDDLYEEVAQRRPESLGLSPNDDEDSASV